MGDRHSDPRLPQREDCVTRHMIEKWAAQNPDQVFLHFDQGPEWTYRETQALSEQAALGLQQLGVRQGDHVLVWMPNGPDIIRAWFAINWLGAIYVPINTSYRGGLLEHVIENSDAKVLIAHADLIGRLNDVDLAKLEKVVVLDGAPQPVKQLEMFGADALEPKKGELAPLERPIEPWDIQYIVYTSGTTGPSKGVLSPYAQAFAMGGHDTFPFIRPEDRWMVNLPLFHVGGTIVVYGMLQRGGSASVVDAFDTNSFWDVIERTQTNGVILLGVMANFLLKLPPGPRDKDHCLKRATVVPLAENAQELIDRFGIEITTVFNMTEVSQPIIAGMNPTKAGSCGKTRPGIQCRLVDGNDCEVPVGEIGELVVRSDMPWAMNAGYYKNPEATAKAWRNGWFHTGDAFRQDAEGSFYFVDRMKDAIRRRGENISSFEVENEVQEHPAVNEVAVVAVPSEMAEDEVMAVISLVPGKELDPKELIEFLIPRMAHFMVPRYIRVVDQLPKTPTAKIQKHILKDQGVTNDTWDREAHGIQVKRERLGASG